MSLEKEQRAEACQLLDGVPKDKKSPPPPFWVQATKSGDMLPLYVHTTKWNKVATRVENVAGDVKALAKALQRALGIIAKLAAVDVVVNTAHR